MNEFALRLGRLFFGYSALAVGSAAVLFFGHTFAMVLVSAFDTLPSLTERIALLAMAFGTLIFFAQVIAGMFELRWLSWMQAVPPSAGLVLVLLGALGLFENTTTGRTDIEQGGALIGVLYVIARWSHFDWLVRVDEFIRELISRER